VILGYPWWQIFVAAVLGGAGWHTGYWLASIVFRHEWKRAL
jgi:hypothetical protein